jgi:hypothetical protein
MLPTIGGASSTIDTLHFVSAHPMALIERCDLRSALKEYVDIEYALIPRCNGVPVYSVANYCEHDDAIAKDDDRL